jgi:predicted secreted protein
MGGEREMNKLQLLQRSLKDRRSGKVIFLSHCILNENTRYLGGACRGGGIREIIEQFLDKDIGIVQMPCPEQLA